MASQRKSTGSDDKDRAIPVSVKVKVDPSLGKEEAGSPLPAPERSESSKEPDPRPKPVKRSRRSTSRTATADPSPPSRKYWGLPMWGWLLIVVVLLSVLFLVCDLKNRNRFMMVCNAKSLELHQGRRVPWPFGHEIIGGPAFKPVAIDHQADCRSRVFQSREEAEQGLLEFILTQVRGALDLPGENNLKKTRGQVLQALLLTRTHRSKRKSVQQLLAEVAYRQGRNGVSRIEDELRTALSRFKEAKQLDGEKYEDLEDWISHLEDLLRGISPSPATDASASAVKQPLPLQPASSPKGAPPAEKVPEGPDAGPTSPDTGPLQEGSGILM